jgi:chromosome partitioning protein
VIVICPKCSRKHKVNPDAVKPYVQSGKKLFATCRACKYRFPVLAATLSGLETGGGQPVSEVKARARKICVTLSKGGVGKTTTSDTGSCWWIPIPRASQGICWGKNRQPV